MTSGLRRLLRPFHHAAIQFRTKSLVPPGHFYSPVPSRRDIQRALASQEASVTGITLRESEQLERLAILAPLFDGVDSGPRYRPDNEMFPRSDASVYRAMIRESRPRLIVEVGVGHSSAACLDALEADGIGARVRLIDPYPDRVESVLSAGDLAAVDIHRNLVQDTALDVFQELQPGDILFIDSTHVVKAGSDVNFLLLNVLPRLNAGVRIHIHDIFWPFEYPSSWFDEGRAWNEAYLLRAFLAFNSSFRIDLFSSFVQSKHPAAFAELTGAAGDDRAGSIWLEKVE